MTNIGKVEFIVDFDGKTLPAQAKKIGEQVGGQLGKATASSFDKEMSGVGERLKKQMSEDGDLAGINFSRSLRAQILAQRSSLTNTLASIFSDRGQFDEFVKSSGNVDDGIENVRASLVKLREEGGLTWNEFQSLNKTTNDWAESLRLSQGDIDAHRGAIFNLKQELYDAEQNYDRVNDAFKDVLPNLRKVTDEVDRQSGSSGGGGWKALSHNLRQAIIIVGAIAAAGEEIAVLGSAAGAGLTIVGLSLASLVTIGGVVFAGLKNIGDELETLPEAVRPAAAAIQGLGDDFTAMQDKIEVGLLAGLEDEITNLTTNLLPSLSAGFVGIAEAVNKSLGPILEKLGSAETAAQLDGIFANMAQDATNLVEAIGNIGEIIGNLLTVAGPFVNQFTGWIEDITRQFADFTGSLEGQNQIAEWFENGVTVLSSFLDLVVAASDVLANLVTPETVAATVEFLDNLAGAMPFIQELLEVFGALDVFGLAAKLLNDVGNALKPFLDLLEPVAELLSNGVALAIDLVSTGLMLLAPLFAPIQLAFEIWSDIIEEVTNFLAPFIAVIQEALTPLQDLGNQIYDRVKPALDEMLASLKNLLPSPEELARILRDEVVPAIEEFAGWIVDTAVPALEGFFGWIGDTVDALGGFEGISSRVGAFFTALKTSIDIIMAPLNLFLDVVNTIIGALNTLSNTQATVPNVGGGGVGALFNASGAVANKATFGIYGEDGPEAIVPLNRDLSRVDPAVRDLSAIAQGKATATYTDSSQRSVTVAPGAISVVGVRDESQAASAVLDRLVAFTEG